ncbi:MAG: hypothetical protein K0S15_1983 [Solirubrobacterales bacterium]|jgi:uncharacterized protein (DUF2267 family)|nr:hypothetical protein [Solirubrobacterales bacterium]
MSDVSVIDRTVEKTNIWLNDLAEELGSDDRKAAYRVLRAYLHAVRDRLTVNEAAQLAAQLPELIRGTYYEGWVPARTPVKYRTVDEFLLRVAREAQLPGETQASYACSAAARVLRRHVSQGEIEDVVSVFPEEMRPVLAG